MKYPKGHNHQNIHAICNPYNAAVAVFRALRRHGIPIGNVKEVFSLTQELIDGYTIVGGQINQDPKISKKFF